MNRTRRALLCAATLIAVTLPVLPPTATTAAAAGGTGGGRPNCVSSPRPAPGSEARAIVDIARTAQSELGLRSVILRVTRGGREVVTAATGESMTGVPATPDMHLRVGSVGIEYMGTVLLELVDEGRVSLDDPVSRWLPDLPHANEITLRMLGNSTSGLHDYVTDPVFLAELGAHPFRHWTPQELVGISTAHDLWYEPGTNWSYSHANFVLLGAALEKITGIRLDHLLRRRVTGPLGLPDTRNSFTPEIAPPPVLHAFSSGRGTYEETTYWNPSWTTAPGAVLTSHICDLARSARGIGRGELLSPEAFAIQLDPGTVGLGHETRACPRTVCLRNTGRWHFGMGFIVDHDWIYTNPSFTGYAAISAYFPGSDLAVAVSATEGPDTDLVNPAEEIQHRIAALLTPGHVPGGPDSA
ncbi:serine hydrolase [Streptomyces sp. NRRL S-87]|uniref:serine hydrolase domain-containing protein n=1 Tax=Streptomyces sp. NRRL S-87 TaxID=1463920 RepID=UPI0004C08CD5|nr:serine hydrolase domain-containing protein [Streptomyces sp. NRRL S-87]